jgi:type III pantothenate kinase
MILAVDIGNTNIVVGFLDKTNIIAQGRIGTDKRKTEMDFLINFRLMIQVYGINIKDIEGAILSSVVPEITHEV